MEGDDAIVSADGLDVSKLVQDLESLGMAVKYAVADRPGDAGFCSMYWDREYNMVCEPYSRIAHFCYSSRRSCPEDQLAAKAMSLWADCARCPVLGALASAYSRERTVQGIHLTSYEVGELRRDGVIVRPQSQGNSLYVVECHRLPYICPTYQSRLLFEKLYGMSCMAQVECEENILQGYIERAGQIIRASYWASNV